MYVGTCICECSILRNGSELNDPEYQYHSIIHNPEKKDDKKNADDILIVPTLGYYGSADLTPKSHEIRTSQFWLCFLSDSE